MTNQAVAAPADSGMYEPAYQQAMFDEMQGTYELVSTVCSFGFNRRWRRQLAGRMRFERGGRSLDLMCGAGEAWCYLLRAAAGNQQLVALDFSSEMLRQAGARQRSISQPVHLLAADGLTSGLAAGSFDRVYCAYGVKTLSEGQAREFAGEAHRLLRPGGTLGLVEVTLPRFLPSRLPYYFYLRWAIPLVGRLFLGDPQGYRMLATYLEHFQTCDRLVLTLTEAGFEVCKRSLFWGCATMLVATRR